MASYDPEWYKSYERKRGKKPAVGHKERTITFSWVKLDINQGQSIKTWEEKGLLAELCEMMRQVGQYSTREVLARQMIKTYTKVGFPPNSEFDVPKHVSPKNWSVLHIKPNSKEVVVGYIENDVFNIVFLDEEHKFWPVQGIQNKGKNRK
ncbi:hypothetical protein [Ulvibacterium sp.]|uniref:hypothetical protein n=1 Tax=Ulvibacterium sp. TaxID=2665914 RepID=UPI003CC5F8FE